MLPIINTFPIFGILPTAPMYESERITRKNRIDQQLKAAGWKIVPYLVGMEISSLSEHAIEEYQTANGPADYALVAKGMLLGIVEAKKLDVGAANVLEQAKRYSKGVSSVTGEWNEYRVPFLYSTNGELIYHLDIRNAMTLSREIFGFHTPEALQAMFFGDKEKAFQWLKAKPNDNPRLRDYQKQAVEAFEHELEEGKRLMLLAMATGTGKTFTTVNLVYRMLASGFAKRVLFLVDRKSLAAQAVTAFASYDTPRNIKFKDEYEMYSQRFKRDDFEGEAYDPTVLPNSYLTNPDGSKTFLYICTIQRMAFNLYGESAVFPDDEENQGDETERLPIPSHAFDLIIADECHRGYPLLLIQIQFFMSLRKKVSDEVAKATTRKSSLASIDANLELGKDLTLPIFSGLLQDTEIALADYNTKLSMTDEARNKFEVAEKALSDMSKRMLAGVGVKYGYDSIEYEKAGGTRYSDRKRPAKKLVLVKN